VSRDCTLACEATSDVFYWYRRGVLACPVGTGGRERVSAAAAARAGNAGREASGCENCLLSSHPPPRSRRNLPLLVGCTMLSFYVFLALLGTGPVLSTAPVECIAVSPILADPDKNNCAEQMHDSHPSGRIRPLNQSEVVRTVLLSSQFWPMPSMSRGVINCAKQFLSHPFSRIRSFDQWAVDRDPVLTLTTSAKIGKTAIGCSCPDRPESGRLQYQVALVKT